MIKHLLLAILASVALATSSAYAANEARWHGKLLVQVSSKSELPAAIRVALHMDEPGMAGVADIGQNFNLGDAHVADWPDRGLLGAGHLGDDWIVVLVHNGGQSAPRLGLYEFHGSTMRDHRQLRYWKGGADTFAAVVSEVVE